MTSGSRRVIALAVSSLALLLAACSHAAPLETDAKIARPVTAAAARLDAGQALDGTLARSDAEGRLEVYVYLAETGSDPARDLASHGLEGAVINKALGLAQGWVRPADLRGLAALPFVKRITLPRYALPR